MLKLRLIWPHNAIVSLRSSSRSRFLRRSVWLHSPSLSVHLAFLYLGSLRIVRLRPSHDHAKRLGLPVI